MQPGLPAHSTDPFRLLPLEVLSEIIAYLAPEDYEVLQLMRTSKTWYMTLTARREREWERKCRSWGAKGKSKECRTWFHSWLKTMHKRCIRCQSKTSSTNPTMRFGTIWPAGPSWAIVCDRCRQNISYFCTTILAAPAYRDGLGNLSQSDLDTLPSLPLTSRDSGADLYYLRKHRIYSVVVVEAKRQEIKAEIWDKLDLLISSFSGDREQLRAAIDSRSEDIFKSSQILQRLFNESVDNQISISTKVGEEAIAVYASIKEIMLNLRILHASDKQRWSLPLTEAKMGASPRLGSNGGWMKVLYGKAWLDCLFLQEVSQEECLDAFCVLRPSIRICGAGRRCTNLPAYACTQERCGDCCTGPCDRHSIYSDEF
jgi:hypothetical protein